MVLFKMLEMIGILVVIGIRMVILLIEILLLLRILLFWGVGVVKVKVVKSIRVMVVNCILKFGLVVGFWKSVRELW